LAGKRGAFVTLGEIIFFELTVLTIYFTILK
jgi:hypothetical protein